MLTAIETRSDNRAKERRGRRGQLSLHYSKAPACHGVAPIRPWYAQRRLHDLMHDSQRAEAATRQVFATGVQVRGSRGRHSPPYSRGWFEDGSVYLLETIQGTNAT